MAHSVVLNYAEKALTDAGYEISKVNLGVSRNDARFFGTMTLRSNVVTGVNLAVGIRSSTDKSLSLGWCCGNRVFCCDNLAFSSDKVISRKHTTNGVLRYQEAICRVVSELADYRNIEEQRIRAMQNRLITEVEAESFLLRAYEAQLLSPVTLPVAIREWRTPSYHDFDERSVWRLYNAVTFALGKRAKTNPQAHAAATIKLGGILSPASEPHHANAV